MRRCTHTLIFKYSQNRLGENSGSRCRVASNRFEILSVASVCNSVFTLRDYMRVCYKEPLSIDLTLCLFIAKQITNTLFFIKLARGRAIIAYLNTNFLKQLVSSKTLYTAFTLFSVEKSFTALVLSLLITLFLQIVTLSSSTTQSE